MALNAPQPRPADGRDRPRDPGTRLLRDRQRDRRERGDGAPPGLSRAASDADLPPRRQLVNIDDALTTYRGELIAAARRWQKARARRRHRIALVTSALAVAGIIVGTAIAATGWLVGSPAPKNVKSDFGSYAPQLGFNPEPGKAVLVAHDGPYKMYVTPDKQGGYCTLVATPQYHPGPHGSGGDCGTRRQAAVSFLAGPVGARCPDAQRRSAPRRRRTNPKQSGRPYPLHHTRRQDRHRTDRDQRLLHHRHHEHEAALHRTLSPTRSATGRPRSFCSMAVGGNSDRRR